MLGGLGRCMFFGIKRILRYRGEGLSMSIDINHSIEISTAV